MNLNAEITANLAAQIANGVDVRIAWEKLFGEGSWDKMAEQVQEALKAKAN